MSEAETHEKMEVGDLKREDSSEESKHQSNEPAFKLTRKKFLTSYKLHYALKSIIISPFEGECFGLPEFVKWVSKAKEFTIKKTWKGNSVGMLSFATYADADCAICELRLALGDRTEIRHTKSNRTNPEVEVDAMLDYAIHASLATRIIVLEGLPPEVTQEQISEFFPDARTVILVKHDPEVEGIGLVEYATTDKARLVLEEHKFPEDDRSYIVVGGQRVVLSKYKNRLNQAERTMRKNPPAPDPRQEFEKVPLSDDERLEKCVQLKSYVDQRDACLDEVSQEPIDRVNKYIELTQNMGTLAAYLNWDASRRDKEKLALPEPAEIKTWKLLYKEEMDDGSYTDRAPNGDGGEVRSLLDINPFEVPGGKKRTQEMPADAGGPAKRLTDSSFPVEFAAQTGGYSMIQGLRNISHAFTAQLNRIDEMLQVSWTTDGPFRTYSGRSHSARRHDTSSRRK